MNGRKRKYTQQDENKQTENIEIVKKIKRDPDSIDMKTDFLAEGNADFNSDNIAIRKYYNHHLGLFSEETIRLSSDIQDVSQLTLPVSSNVLSPTKNQLMEKSNQLRMKLNTALEYVLRTCMFGASNKITDIEKTYGGVLFIKYRYEYYGKYIKHTSWNELDVFNKKINSSFNLDTRKFIPLTKSWNYSSNKSEHESIPVIKCRFPGVDPINDPKFDLNEELEELLKFALSALQRRQGNCQLRSCLLAKYLWENNAGIDKIELVSTSTFDHVFVIVNRSGDLYNSSTWGDAWIIDPWYGKNGLIFHASDFVNKIKEIKSFAIYQAKKLENIGKKNTCAIKDNESETLDKCLYKIKPDRDPYPSYSFNSPTTVFYPIEYYYEVSTTYTLELYNEDEMGVPILDDNSSIDSAIYKHKNLFKNCLDELSMHRHIASNSKNDIFETSIVNVQGICQNRVPT